MKEQTTREIHLLITYHGKNFVVLIVLKFYVKLQWRYLLDVGKASGPNILVIFLQ